MLWFRTVPTGTRIAAWDRQGRVEILAGPQRAWTWGKRIETLPHITAGPDEYLRIVRSNGSTEHRAGPCELWQHPVEHQAVEVLDAVDIDAHEAVVVYRQEGAAVTRRVVGGPARFIPGPTEWLHQFSWHGAHPKDPTLKVPRALTFTKLRTIPDQMYVDVRDVRTADDALVVIKLMIFFELSDVERMLDQTHDPVGDFLNAVTADTIDHVARHPFEAFKEHTAEFNDLDFYRQLVARAETIGYRIAKVVYRGYHASDKLQQMHDQAIEMRTGLKLQDETERQAQTLADLKLEREQEREKRKQAMAETALEHDNRLDGLRTAQELADARRRHEHEIAASTDTQRLELEHEQAMNGERLRFFDGLKGAGVDLTRYLVAQYQHPDRLIRIDGGADARVHLHHGEERA